MNPKDVTQEYLDAVAHKLNNTPRRILEYRTPAEVFIQHVKSSKDKSSRVKPASPAVEVLSVDYQNSLRVALHLLALPYLGLVV